MEDIASQLSQVTIPAGITLHLFDVVKKEIVRPHFVSTGPINVLVMEGHGPVYSLLKDYFTSPSFMSKIKDMVDDIKSVYYEEGARDATEFVINNIEEDMGSLEGIDALLMATTTDGKAALLFVHKGEKPSLHYLR